MRAHAPCSRAHADTQTRTYAQRLNDSLLTVIGVGPEVKTNFQGLL